MTFKTFFLTRRIFATSFLAYSLTVCAFPAIAQNKAMHNKHHAPTAMPLDSIVASVNESLITESELNQATDTAVKQFKNNSAQLPPQAILQKQVLDQLINRKLQLQVAEQVGIQISDAEIDKTIQNIAAQNNLTPDQLFQQIAEHGLTTQEYRQEIKEELTLQQIQQQEVGAHITISKEEIDDVMRSADWKAYNAREYHIEDILIPLAETASDDEKQAAEKQANALLQKIRGGLNFRDAALEESKNSQALQGGDMGWLKLPQIPPQAASQLVQARKNAIIGPIFTSNGFHLIHLAGIRKITPAMDKTALRKQVEQLIFQRKADEALQSWITKLRSQAYIVLHPDA